MSEQSTWTDKVHQMEKVAILEALVAESTRKIDTLQQALTTSGQRVESIQSAWDSEKTRLRDWLKDKVEVGDVSRAFANELLSLLNLDPLRPLRRVIIKSASDELLFEIDEIESDKDDDSLASHYKDKVQVYGVAKKVVWTFTLHDDRMTETKEQVEEGDYVDYDMHEDDCEYEIDNLSVTVEEC